MPMQSDPTDKYPCIINNRRPFYRNRSLINAMQSPGNRKTKIQIFKIFFGIINLQILKRYMIP